MTGIGPRFGPEDGKLVEDVKWGIDLFDSMDFDIDLGIHSYSESARYCKEENK
jgi:hypothetical protein